MAPEQLFELRSLADRYQLAGLKQAVESEIAQDVSTSNCLVYLSKVIGSGEKLERTCWELVDKEKDKIMDLAADSLTSLLKTCPELGTALLMRERKRRKIS